MISWFTQRILPSHTLRLYSQYLKIFESTAFLLTLKSVNFDQDKLRFFGFVVWAQGIRIEEKKIKVV